jgi:2,3-diaminopropionate biosynthesis protein SbnB
MALALGPSGESRESGEALQASTRDDRIADAGTHPAALARRKRASSTMADDGSLLLLTGDEVRAQLAQREPAVLDAVRAAYLVHGAGETSLPHSLFLRFPEQDANRIIALPAFLGGGFGVAGMKWISSFPANHLQGLPRASAILVLNSCVTGRAEAILEASLISAARTAASAAIAAAAIAAGAQPDSVGLIGCGPINLETAHYLRVALPSVRRFALYDREQERAEHAAATLRQTMPGAEVTVAATLDEALANPLISFGTTASSPHVHDLSACPPGAILLHVSLRDLAPALILGCDNVVDDRDHVCRASTSVHLAEQLSGSRAFIRCTLADILAGRAAPRRDAASLVAFSPFGLGILDLAVGALVRDLAAASGRGHVIPSFQPSPAGTAELQP